MTNVNRLKGLVYVQELNKYDVQQLRHPLALNYRLLMNKVNYELGYWICNQIIYYIINMQNF